MVRGDQSMKVGDLIKDDDGDFGVIVDFDGTNPIVYFTETKFSDLPDSYCIERETVREIVYEDR